MYTRLLSGRSSVIDCYVFCFDVLLFRADDEQTCLEIRNLMVESFVKPVSAELKYASYCISFVSMVQFTYHKTCYCIEIPSAYVMGMIPVVFILTKHAVELVKFWPESARTELIQLIHKLSPIVCMLLIALRIK